MQKESAGSIWHCQMDLVSLREVFAKYICVVPEEIDLTFVPRIAVGWVLADSRMNYRLMENELVSARSLRSPVAGADHIDLTLPCNRVKTCWRRKSCFTDRAMVRRL
jgi:hypothetical protein